MQTIESLTELLRMAHEQIDTEVAKNAELKKGGGELSTNNILATSERVHNINLDLRNGLKTANDCNLKLKVKTESLQKANAELKEALSFCVPHAAWALQGQMFNKSIIQAKQLLEREQGK